MPNQLPINVLVQFPVSGGRFHIDQIVDPTGVPLDVLDQHAGFTLTGSVTLPYWVTGTGRVTLAADEIGGPFDQELKHVDFPIPGGTDPGPSTYNWSLTVPPVVQVPVDKMYQLTLVFGLRTPAGKHTDVAACYDLGAYLIV